MHTRSTILAMAALTTLLLAACSNANPGGGSTSSFSYSEASSTPMQASSAMMNESSAMMNESSAMMEQSTSSAQMQASSAMTNTSSASSMPLAADNATSVLAVQNFYISALHQSDLSNSPYLTDSAKAAVQAGGMSTVFCANQKPSNFSLVAIGASNTQRNVVVTEMFHAGSNIDVTVSAVHQADGWKIDSFSCGASAAASSM
ncbi:MAG TPA: hypothetical protein VHA78_00835 [Candidatus Peribacteraceae bacterium]|nr:hypothetical protein [Candidatus Peribacteraceae bacterium]